MLMAYPAQLLRHGNLKLLEIQVREYLIPVHIVGSFHFTHQQEIYPLSVNLLGVHPVVLINKHAGIDKIKYPSGNIITFT